MSNRPPDYRIKVLNKITDGKATIGAAWANHDGSISIVLDECVVLYGGKTDLVINLFPIDRKEP